MKYTKICIDAGHGGTDPGAVANGLKESNLNLSVVKYLGPMLKKAGYSVTYTRTTDIFLELNERVKIAQKAGCQIFISVHHNAGGGMGWEVIFECDDIATKKLAECIGKYFTLAGQTKHGKGVYCKPNSHGDDYFGVLRNGSMDGVITEFAYLDSKDHEDIDTQTKLKKEAEALFKGIQEYNK